MIFTSCGLGLFKCIGDSGKEYMVDRENKSCTCKSWYYGKRPCKHLKFLGVKEWEEKNVN